MDRRAIVMAGIISASVIPLLGGPTGSAGGSSAGRPAGPGKTGPGTPQRPGMGWQHPWRGQGGPWFSPQATYWPFVPWFNGTSSMPWTSAASPYPLFSDGLRAADYAPAAPPNEVAPQVNAPAPINGTPSETLTSDGSTASANEDTGARFYQSTVAAPVVLDEYPSLVVLKSGGVYGATKYWTKAKTFYFRTPTGQTFRVPLKQLEQIYPGTKRGRNK